MLNINDLPGEEKQQRASLSLAVRCYAGKMRDTLNSQIGNHYTILPSLNTQIGYCNTMNAPWGWGWEEPASILKLDTIIQYTPGWRGVGRGKSGEGRGPSFILAQSTQYTDSSYCEFDLKYTKSTRRRWGKKDDTHTYTQAHSKSSLICQLHCWKGSVHKYQVLASQKYYSKLRCQRFRFFIHQVY